MVKTIWLVLLVDPTIHCMKLWCLKYENNIHVLYLTFFILNSYSDSDVKCLSYTFSHKRLFRQDNILSVKLYELDKA